MESVISSLKSGFAVFVEVGDSQAKKKIRLAVREAWEIFIGKALVPTNISVLSDKTEIFYLLLPTVSYLGKLKKDHAVQEFWLNWRQSGK
jgi:hypothetical protein